MYFDMFYYNLLAESIGLYHIVATQKRNKGEWCISKVVFYKITVFNHVILFIFKKMFIIPNLKYCGSNKEISF